MSSETRLLELKDRNPWCGKNNPYFVLVKFLAPVALTIIAIDVGEQALNRSLASSFDAVDTLAGFGISYVIVKLATGMLSEIKMVSIMLLHNHSDRIRIGICVLVGGCVVVACSFIISFSKFGYYLIDALHRVPPNVSQIAKDSILYLAVFPLIDGFAWLHTGVLLRFKYSFTVGSASLLDNIVQVITVVVMLNTRFSRTKPILIPVLATYFGTLARLVAILVAYYKYIHHQLHPNWSVDGVQNADREKLGFRRILSFWGPLALVQLCQRISRPIVNLFVARDRLGGVTREEAVRGVAVLSVCYPIGHLPYGWLNTLRSVEPAFVKKVQEGEANVTIKNIRIFQLCCFFTSCMLMVVLFWIPGVAPAILAKVSNVDQEIIRDAVIILHVFSFFSIPVANRAILTGMFVAQKNTKYLYPSIPARLITLVAMLFILPRLGIHGSLMGVSALISGFLAESLCSLFITLILYMRSTGTEQIVDVHDNDSSNEREAEL